MRVLWPDSLPLYPLLPGLYHVVPLSADRVQIANAGRSVVLSGDGFALRVLPLLEALDGRTNLQDLRRRFPDLVPHVLDALVAKGMVTGGTVASSDMASSFTDTALALGPDSSPCEASEILASAVVAVVGCGPVGSAVANLLAKAGVGRLLLSDSDSVYSADIPLSPSLSVAHEGQPRVEATRKTCVAGAATSAETMIQPREQDLKAAGVELVVLEVGYEHDDFQPSTADALLHAGIPFLMHTQDALEALIGPMVTSGVAPCHRCTLTRLFSNRDDLDEHLAYRAHRAHMAPKPDAFLGAHCSIVAGIVAVSALRSLVARPPHGVVRMVDLLDVHLRQETIVPVPDCSGCAGSHTGGVS